MLVSVAVHRTVTRYAAADKATADSYIPEL